MIPPPASMTPFEHLTVLVSIVIGLGIAHLLTTAHALVQVRARVRMYWLPALWFVLIFISLIEWWWAIFALRTTVKWNFFYFLFLLMSPVTMYLAAAFVLPDDSERGQDVIDLRRYYYENSAWLFGVLAVSPALDGIRRGVTAGSFLDLGAFSNLISAVLVASMGATKKPWYHATISLLVGAIFLSFIVSSALELR
ncbi:MAG: hypothetical protein JWM95_4677 [Gemmatimonadetes bacterium]|nr:hypothetical protein [Gemmatimonadota bacterium]